MSLYPMYAPSPHNHVCPSNHSHPRQPRTPPATMHTPATTHAPQQPHTPPPPATTHGPPVNRMTNRCKHITLPETSFAGSKHEKVFCYTLSSNTLSKVQKILQNATMSENTFQSFNIEVYENFFFS